MASSSVTVFTIMLTSNGKFKVGCKKVSLPYLYAFYQSLQLKIAKKYFSELPFRHVLQLRTDLSMPLTVCWSILFC
jgi:hypothetical protein